METTDYVGLAFGAGGAAPGSEALRAAVVSTVGPGAKVRSRGRAILALFEVNGGGWSSDEAERLRRAVSNMSSSAVSVGVGGPRPRAAGPYGVAYQAEQALALGRTLFGPGRVTRYDQLGAFVFVLGRPTFELRAFCERVLGPLGEPQHAELLRTLHEFVQAHGSLNEVARRMYLHRNTVRGRLKRIAEITGADLTDHDDRLMLQLALLGRTALERIADGGASAGRTDVGDAP